MRAHGCVFAAKKQCLFPCGPPARALPLCRASAVLAVKTVPIHCVPMDTAFALLPSRLSIRPNRNEHTLTVPQTLTRCWKAGRGLRREGVRVIRVLRVPGCVFAGGQGPAGRQLAVGAFVVPPQVVPPPPAVAVSLPSVPLRSDRQSRLVHQPYTVYQPYTGAFVAPPRLSLQFHRLSLQFHRQPL